jgi:cyclase
MGRTRSTAGRRASMRPRSVQYAFEELADGVVAAISSPTGSSLCNSLLVDLGAETLIFDTSFTPQAATDLLAESRRRFGERPHIVVNSHKHDDHMRGNQSFPGARIVATGGTREGILEKTKLDLPAERKGWRELLDLLKTGAWPASDAERWGNVARGVLESLGSLAIVPPNWTFERSLEIHGTKRTAHLRSFGGGHTSSDGFLELPDDGILALGDLLTVSNHPSIGDGNIVEWRRILGEITTLRWSRALPGHGPVGGRESIAPLLRYFDDLEYDAARHRRKGTPPASPELGAVPPPYADWAMPVMYGENLSVLLRRPPA